MVSLWVLQFGTLSKPFEIKNVSYLQEIKKTVTHLFGSTFSPFSFSNTMLLFYLIIFSYSFPFASFCLKGSEFFLNQWSKKSIKITLLVNTAVFRSNHFGGWYCFSLFDHAQLVFFYRVWRNTTRLSFTSHCASTQCASSIRCPRLGGIFWTGRREWCSQVPMSPGLNFVSNWICRPRRGCITFISPRKKVLPFKLGLQLLLKMLRWESWLDLNCLNWASFMRITWLDGLNICKFFFDIIKMV